MSAHVHVFIHVAGQNWLGHPAIICRCACGLTLTPEEIVQLQAGEAA